MTARRQRSDGARPGQTQVLIVAQEPFPAGMAATNRIISLARGLTEGGARVKVVLMRAGERPGRPMVNPDAKGVVHGVEFEYACGTTVCPETLPGRKLLRLRTFARAAALLRELPGKKGEKHLILYLSGPGELLFFFVLTRLFGIRMLQDKSEYPFVLHSRSVAGRLYARLYTSVVYRLFDAMFVMTRPLERYFRPRLRRSVRSRLLHIPMTVELSRFAPDHDGSPESSPYIAYCGYLGGNKDGVPILIRAFALLSERWPDVKLYIIGDAPGSGELDSLRALARALNVGRQVVFTGMVPRDEMPRYLRHASVLALARPSSLQAEGGFPTKLGEYLATGNPVVVTAVGEIPEYLSDGVSSFLSPPDSAEAFAGRLDAVLRDLPAAREVGRRGMEVAAEHFDYRRQGLKALRFLQGLQ